MLFYDQFHTHPLINGNQSNTPVVVLQMKSKGPSSRNTGT